MLTLDSGSVSLSRSARGDSVQKIWLVGRHSDPFTLENTVFRCVTLPPLGMFPKFWLIPLTRTFWSLRVTLHYLSLLAFVLWLAWDIIGYVVSEKLQRFLLSSPSVWKNALLVLDCTQSHASVTWFSPQGHDVRMTTSAWMHSCAADLFQVQCRLFSHAVLSACDTFFVCQIARRVLRY